MTRDDLGPHDRILNTETEWVGPDDPFTAEEQEEQCCATVSADECADDGKVEDYNAAPVDELDLEELKRQAAIRFGVDIVEVRVDDVGPKGPCGKKYTEWKETLNCCDGVSEMVMDDDESGEVVAPGSYVDVEVTGGRLPFNVSVRGYGFYLDEDRTVRDGQVASKNIRIYAADDACGSSIITVYDGCSEVEWWIRSTNGKWEMVGDIAGDTCQDAISLFGGEVVEGEEFNWATASDVDIRAFPGPYRVTQRWGTGPVGSAGCSSCVGLVPASFHPDVCVWSMAAGLYEPSGHNIGPFMQSGYYPGNPCEPARYICMGSAGSDPCAGAVSLASIRALRPIPYADETSMVFVEKWVC